jgi:hypothetical protein
MELGNWPELMNNKLLKDKDIAGIFSGLLFQPQD